MPPLFEFDASVDLALLDRAIIRVNEELGIELPKVIRTTARTLAVELMRLLPPKSLAQGRAAVARDVGRAVWLLDPSKIKQERFREAVQNRDMGAVQKIIDRLRAEGKWGKYTVRYFLPSLHLSARNSRGRVQRTQPNITLDASEYKRYVRAVQGHVGATKYAFGVAAQRLGASNVPGWVLRHSPALGDFREDYTPESPSVEMTNRGPGVGNLSRSSLQFAIDRRARAMTRDVDQVLSGRLSRYFD